MTEQLEISDKQIREALTDYDYTFLADTIRVVYENGVEVEGVLCSITPVYMLKDKDGTPHSIRTDKLIDTVRVRTATVDERLQAVRHQREQIRKAALLGAVCEGASIVVQEQKTSSGVEWQ